MMVYQFMIVMVHMFDFQGDFGCMFCEKCHLIKTDDFVIFIPEIDLGCIDNHTAHTTWEYMGYNIVYTTSNTGFRRVRTANTGVLTTSMMINRVVFWQPYFQIHHINISWKLFSSPRMGLQSSFYRSTAQY